MKSLIAYMQGRGSDLPNTGEQKLNSIRTPGELTEWLTEAERDGTLDRLLKVTGGPGGDDAVHVAVQFGHLDILSVLQTFGADLNATTDSGHNYVHLATQFGQLHILRALKDWDVDLNTTTNDGFNAVHIAVQYGHLDILRELRDWNVALNATLVTGHNAVHVAARYGQVDMIRPLQSWNVDLTATSTGGFNAVHIAAKNGRLDILRELRGCGVDLNATTNHGLTAVHLAAKYDHLDVLRELRVWGVDLNATTHKDRAPLTYCFWQAEKPIKEFQVRSGLPTAKLLILLGAQVRQGDLCYYRKGMKTQLMAWAEGHLARHHMFKYTVLHAIHADGTHTAEDQTNCLARLSGFVNVRKSLAEYLGIRSTAELRRLGSAKAVWNSPRSVLGKRGRNWMGPLLNRLIEP